MICNYDRCPEALDFHHIDPFQKDFQMGDILASPQRWTIIVAELKKCVLLCANCHRELHAGVANIPENAAVFDEAWEDYRAIEKTFLTEVCYCGAPMRPEAKHCSLRCAGIHRERFDWNDYDLSTMLKTMTRTQISREIGVSMPGLSKRLSIIKKCLICSSDIPSGNITFCSMECAGKHRTKGNWDQYDIEEMLKTMSKRAIAKMVGVSDVAVHKKLRRIKLARSARVELA